MRVIGFVVGVFWDNKRINIILEFNNIFIDDSFNEQKLNSQICELSIFY